MWVSIVFVVEIGSGQIQMLIMKAQCWARNTGNWFFFSFSFCRFCHHVNVYVYVLRRIESVFWMCICECVIVRKNSFVSSWLWWTMRLWITIVHYFTAMNGPILWSCVTIWRLLCLIRIQRLNLPIFTGPQWIWCAAVSCVYMACWLWHWPYCELVHCELMLQYI